MRKAIAEMIPGTSAGRMASPKTIGRPQKLRPSRSTAIQRPITIEIAADSTAMASE